LEERALIRDCCRSNHNGHPSGWPLCIVGSRGIPVRLHVRVVGIAVIVSPEPQ
jgi:hypothetical protein